MIPIYTTKSYVSVEKKKYSVDTIAPEMFSKNIDIFRFFPRKHMFWVLIRSAPSNICCGYS